MPCVLFAEIRPDLCSTGTAIGFVQSEAFFGASVEQVPLGTRIMALVSCFGLHDPIILFTDYLPRNAVRIFRDRSGAIEM